MSHYISWTTLPELTEVTPHLTPIIDDEPTKNKSLPAFMTNLARTQKARGLYYAPSLNGINNLIIKYLIHKEKEIEDIPPDKYPFFARPCPTIPRHGFVDSVVVNDSKELRKVVEDTFKVEPKGEVMLTTPYKPTYNQIWTPSLITFGKGHDGATGGRDTIVLPAVHNVPAVFNDARLGIAKGEVPYVELISGGTCGSYPLLTQVRSGPDGGEVGNYIPKTFTPTNVLLARGDLLEWEETIKYNSTPLTVVHNPGGSPTDHFSVHCRAKGVAVVYDADAPKVGVKLKKSVTAKATDYNAVLNGYAVGASIKLSRKELESAARVMLYALHHSSVLNGRESFWIGVGIAFFLRLGMIALRGEARHFRPTHQYSVSRREVYTHSLNRSITSLRRSLPKLLTLYAHGDWGGSMGGKKWAQCGVAVRDLFNATRAFNRMPTKAKFSRLMVAYNVAINQAHNNGWWMNKFVDLSIFDQFLSHDPSVWPKMSSILYRIRTHHAGMTPKEFDSEVKTTAEWPITQFHSTPWKSVEIKVSAISAEIVRLEPSRNPFGNIRTFTTQKLTTIMERRNLLGGSWPKGKARIDKDGIYRVKLGNRLIKQTKLITPEG